MEIIGFASELAGQKFFGRRLGAVLAGFVPCHEMIQNDLREPLLISRLAPRIGRHVGQDQDPRRRDALLKRCQVFIVENGLA